MQEIKDLMMKMEQLLDSVPEGNIVEELKNNKTLIDKICAIAEQSDAYKHSASKREQYILEVMDKCGDKEDCLIYTWIDSLMKINAVPMPLLPTVVIMTMPCVQHFLND